MQQMVRGTTLDDIPLGLSAVFSRTVGESDVYLFAGITGDIDPNHLDEEFCKTTSFGRRIAHGALIVGYMSTGSMLVLQWFDRPMVSAGFDRIRFIKPLYIGDTITVRYEIVDKIPEKERTVGKIEATNQHGDMVAVATHVMQLV
jgi:3-hydroxybutyryl-CoA dehydratase